MTAVYSAPFVIEKGLNGAGTLITVPAGYVYVVKQLTAYATPVLGQTRVFFHDVATGATLWSAAFQITEGGWAGFYGSLAFEAGSSLQFSVDNALGEQADVYAGGYALVN